MGGLSLDVIVMAGWRSLPVQQQHPSPADPEAVGQLPAIKRELRWELGQESHGEDQHLGQLGAVCAGAGAVHQGLRGGTLSMFGQKPEECQ